MWEWQPPEWVCDTVFYEIFPDRFFNGNKKKDHPNTEAWGLKPTRENFFGGDIAGISQKLDYLHDLGIGCIYLTPIFSSPSNHKYNTTDYFEIDRTLGSKNELKNLVNNAHKRGIRIILDAVFNHCSDGFQAFRDVVEKGEKSKYFDWFLFSGDHLRHDPLNYQTLAELPDYPKLNIDHPEVEEYFLKVGQYWIEKFDIDGWRLDTPWKISMDFWRKFRRAVKTIKPDAYIVGEVWRYPQFWLRGDTCDGVMNYPLRDQIITFIDKKMDSEDFDFENRCLREMHGEFPGMQLNLLGSHDTARIKTLFHGDNKKISMSLTFLFTYVGSPMIYYGDEVGLEGQGDPDCRGTMEWDTQKWDQELLDIIKRLIKLRKENKALTSNNFETLSTRNGLYTYRRHAGSNEVIVILNPSSEKRDVTLRIEQPEKGYDKWEDIFSGKLFYQNNDTIILDHVFSQTSMVLTPIA